MTASSARAILLAVGCCVLVVELGEDVQIVAQARAAGWDADAWRVVAGHALRETLVVTALISVYSNGAFMVPFALGAALHGLFFRSGYFVGAGDIPWGSTYTWVALIDMGWRLGLLVWVGVRFPALVNDLRGKEERA